MGIAGALFTPAQSRLLAWLYGQPERWFYIQELLRLTSLNSVSLQREVTRLHGASLLLEKQIGNRRCVRANPDSPVFQELVKLVGKALGVVPMLTEALRPVASQLHLALVFGFMAEGEHAASDIDILLVSNTLLLHDIRPICLPVEKRLGRRVEPRLYTEAEFALRRQEADSAVSRILATPHVVLFGSLE
ncbi:MAG: nucleotidyltransferase domain-containing protein [Pseudomonadota bacterium]